MVRAIEEQMVLPLPPARRRQLLDDLAICAAALSPEISDQPVEA